MENCEAYHRSCTVFLVTFILHEVRRVFEKIRCLVRHFYGFVYPVNKFLSAYLVQSYLTVKKYWVQFVLDSKWYIELSD